MSLPPERPYRVVIADAAEYGSAAALLACLAGPSFESRTSRSLDELRASLAAEPCDAIVFDVALPGGDGARTVLALRDLAPDAALVALVALGERVAGVEAMRLGAEDYLVTEQLEPLVVERTLLASIERRRTLSDLRQAEAQVRRQALYFESISDAILVADNHDRIVDCNGAAERTFGYSRAEMLGQTPALFRSGLDHPRLREAMLESVRAFGRWSGEVPFVRKDGTTGVNEVLVLPIRDERGEIVGTFGVNREVTERKRLEEQLRHAQALEAVGRLAGGVAHDFNNLLTTILGYCDVMMQDLAEGDPLRPSVREIRRAGERAAALTRQLLAFGRRQVFAAQVVDLNAVVTRAAERMRRGAGEGVEVRLELDPLQSLGVRIDEALLEQLLLNLGANSVDAMPRGGVIRITTGLVRVAAEDSGRTGPRSGEYVELRFEDSGTGMDLETRRHLFEPFFSTKEGGLGRGLGLASVYGTVTQAGGHITVESAPGAGTSFRILLPRVGERPSGEHRLDALRRRDAVVEREPGGSECVLVVEDDDMVRRLARDVLAGRGYRVLEATSAEQALDLLGAHAGVDALLTDLFLAGSSGIDLAQEFLRRCPGGRIVLMSGYADEEALRAGMPGAAAYLQKPFTADLLARRVRRALDAASR